MADLSVDITCIRASASSVRALCGELKGTRDAVDEHRAAIHHDRLSEALEEFSSNWKTRRERMTENLAAFAAWADMAADAYEESDQALARALTEGAPE